MRGEGELHWIMATGVLLVVLSLMICMAIFLLPVFEGERTTGFWFVAMPIAVVGALMVLYRHKQG
jgi:hypothetical protein